MNFKLMDLISILAVPVAPALVSAFNIALSKEHVDAAWKGTGVTLGEPVQYHPETFALLFDKDGNSAPGVSPL